MSTIIVLLSGFLAVCIVSVAYILFSFLFANQSQNVQILNADEFEKQLMATKCEQLIDVRTPREFKKHRIEGAKNMDYLSFDFLSKVKMLDKTKPVMVYCHSGYRSKMILPILCKAGYKIVYELNEGFMAWLKANKPVHKDGF